MASKRTTLFPGKAYMEPTSAQPEPPRSPAKTKTQLAKADPRLGLGPPLPKKVSAVAQVSAVAPKIREAAVGDTQTQQRDPWTDYVLTLYEDQAGWSAVAYSIIPPKFEFVAVKASSIPEGHARPIQAIQHPNVVALRSIYLHDGEYYFVYEMQGLSLHDVLSTPCEAFRPFEIATVCAEVLNALGFLHKDLGLVYQRLTVGNIMMGRSGTIKLGRASPVDGSRAHRYSQRRRLHAGGCGPPLPGGLRRRGTRCDETHGPWRGCSQREHQL
jgi:Protein kinase domain